MDIQIVPVERDQKSVLRQMLELYLYDFGEYNDAELNEHGWYGYERLDYYWIEEGRHPFFVRVSNKLAGFVLVSGHSFLMQDPDVHSITEFFVMRKYRRRGGPGVPGRDLSKTCTTTRRRSRLQRDYCSL